MAILLSIIVSLFATALFSFVLAPNPHVIAPRLIYIVVSGILGATAAALDIYVARPLSLLGLALDVTWSLPNTLIGYVLWLPVCVIRGNARIISIDAQRSGTVVISNAALPGADASTLGTVIGGLWLLHEEVHVWQARIFGPFYWPLYLLSYFANLIVLVCTLRVADLHWSAYGRVHMEDWAFAAAPRGSTELNWGWWLLWFFLVTLNLACLVVVLAAFHALKPYVGFAHVIPWWIGVIGLLLYALIRSFFARSG